MPFLSRSMGSVSTRHAVGRKISYMTEEQIWKIFSLNGLSDLFL